MQSDEVDTLLRRNPKTHAWFLSQWPYGPPVGLRGILDMHNSELALYEEEMIDADWYANAKKMGGPLALQASLTSLALMMDPAERQLKNLLLRKMRKMTPIHKGIATFGFATTLGAALLHKWSGKPNLFQKQYTRRRNVIPLRPETVTLKQKNGGKAYGIIYVPTGIPES
ncbi:MAG: hypothetical protein OIF34_09390 [Porticoccaceae bacterium]|nr:hypothetical protein [Porticoccaceae bacterium]